MKHAAILLALLAAVPSAANPLREALAPCPELPDPVEGEFRLDENVLGVGTNMTLKQTDGDVIASLDEIVLAIGPEYKLKNAQGELVAKAKQKVFSWGVEIHVENCVGTRMFSMEERVLESLFKWRTKHDVRSPDGTVLYKSRKMEVLGDVDIQIEAEGRTRGGWIRRPWHDFAYAEWSGKVVDKESMIVLALAAAYKTRSDNRKKD